MSFLVFLKKVKLEMYSAEFLQNNPSKFLYLSSSDSIIWNSALLENNFLSGAYLIMKSSTIQFNYVTVTRNEFLVLLFISSNSSAVIQNSTLLENDFSSRLCTVWASSTIQLNHVAFLRNNALWLLSILPYSSAIIENNTLLENNFLSAVHDMEEGITIQLINVAFIRNILRSYLLVMLSSSSAKLINNEVVGNRFHQFCFAHSPFLEIDTIFIKNNTFSQLFRVVECNFSFESMKIEL